MRLAQHFRDTPIAEIGQAEIDAAALVICPSTSPATRNCSVYTPTLAILHMAGAYPKVRRPLGAKGKVRTDYLNPADALAVIKAADQLDAEFGTLLRASCCILDAAWAKPWRSLGTVSTSTGGRPMCL
jgi:hypothetical protein